MIGPAAKPWKIRHKISISKLWEMPHNQEAKTKSAVEIRNNFTSPKRLASQPVMGIEIALATPKEVITQVPWLNDAPRSPEIVGIATFAMVESNTCMNVARDSANVMMPRAAPSIGFCMMGKP